MSKLETIITRLNSALSDPGKIRFDQLDASALVSVSSLIETLSGKHLDQIDDSTMESLSALVESLTQPKENPNETEHQENPAGFYSGREKEILRDDQEQRPGSSKPEEVLSSRGQKSQGGIE